MSATKHPMQPLEADKRGIIRADSKRTTELAREEWNRRPADTPVREPVREEATLAEMEARKDAAYLERNRVVAALAKTVITAGGVAGIARTAIEGWSDDWHGCVYIDLPTGQASWHYHDSHAWLFADLPPYLGKWDGHTTDEKYARLEALKPSTNAPVTEQGEEPEDDEPQCAHIFASGVTCVLSRGHLGETHQSRDGKRWLAAQPPAPSAVEIGCTSCLNGLRALKHVTDWAGVFERRQEGRAECLVPECHCQEADDDLGALLQAIYDANTMIIRAAKQETER